MDTCPDRLLRKIATYLTSKDALSMSSTCQHVRKVLSLSAVLVTDQIMPLPLENRNQPSVTKKLLTRVHVPLAHRTQSIAVQVTWKHPSPNHDNGDEAAAAAVMIEIPQVTPRLYILSHHPNDAPLTFDKGTTVASWFPGSQCISLVPSSQHNNKVYTLWCATSRTAHAVQLKVKVQSVIFDLPDKMVAKTYHKLFVKMGSLQRGGLLYLRLLQSLANTLLFALRFQRKPEPGWAEILNEVRIPMELPHIRVLGEVVTWVEEDLAKLDEQPVEDDSKSLGATGTAITAEQEDQNRRRQRRRILFRERHNFPPDPLLMMAAAEDAEFDPQIRRDRQFAQNLQVEQQFGRFAQAHAQQPNAHREFLIRRRAARMMHVEHLQRRLQYHPIPPPIPQRLPPQVAHPLDRLHQQELPPPRQQAAVPEPPFPPVAAAAAAAAPPNIRQAVVPPPQQQELVLDNDNEELLDPMQVDQEDMQDMIFAIGFARRGGHVNHVVGDHGAIGPPNNPPEEPAASPAAHHHHLDDVQI